MKNWIIQKLIIWQLKKLLDQYQATSVEAELIREGCSIAVTVYRRGKKPPLPPDPQSPLPTRSDPVNRSGDSRGMGGR